MNEGNLPKKKPDYGGEVIVSWKPGGEQSEGAVTITPPKQLSTEDPEYRRDARRAKVQGRVVLWLVVTKQGTTDAIQIVKPVGAGLDEAAVAAVSEWKFEPATRNGQPVPLHVDVEVNFRLH